MKTLLRNARACEGKIITENLFFNGHKTPQFLILINKLVNLWKNELMNEKWKHHREVIAQCMWLTPVCVLMFLRGTKSWKISRFNQVDLITDLMYNLYEICVTFNIIINVIICLTCIITIHVCEYFAAFDLFSLSIPA